MIGIIINIQKTKYLCIGAVPSHLDIPKKKFPVIQTPRYCLRSIQNQKERDTVQNNISKESHKLSK